MNSQIDEFIYQSCMLQEDMINISFQSLPNGDKSVERKHSTSTRNYCH